jgi:hypothetical protein
MENADEIDVMIRVKMIVEQIPETEQSIEYKHIVQLIQHFLRVKCPHEVTVDSIDVSPDKSLSIFYCKYCLETFDTANDA